MCLIGKLQFIKGKGKPGVRMNWFVLIREVNYGSQKWPFDCWTSILCQMDLGGQPQEGRKEQYKGIDLWSSFRKLTYQVEGMGEKGKEQNLLVTCLPFLGLCLPCSSLLWPALACSSPSMFLVLSKSTIALVIS